MDELDRLIVAWGRSRRMPEATAVRMRAAILRPPVPRTGLSAEWWQTLNRRTNRLVTEVLSDHAA